MEIWHALRLESIIDQGRTHPLIIDCECETVQNAERRSFLVKALGLPEVHQSSLYNEIFGNLIARKLGIVTPRPAFVDISDDFLTAAEPEFRGHPGFSGAPVALKIGRAAGCEFLTRGLLPVVSGGQLTDIELSQAARIYGFDLMVQNKDRSFAQHRRPNCGHFGLDLVAFDFEMCFSYVLGAGTAGSPWEITKHGIYRDHVFYPQLRARIKSNPDLFDDLESDVKALNLDGILTELVRMPAAWRATEPAKLDHVADVILNAHDFAVELARSLK